nr:hypothetical protein [Devosia indica]
MVRALLNGSKTQTRRTIKMPEWATHVAYDAFHGWRFNSLDHSEPLLLRIDEGDRLWVRESLKIESTDQGVRYPTYAADGAKLWPLSEWTRERNAVPSIHMPRWASRLTLTVTDVRVERLQDCSAADAIAEGIRGNGFEGWVDYSEGDKPCDFLVDPRQSYRTLWNSINGPGAWEANPWVAAYTFTVQRRNIDQLSGTK